MIKFRGVVECLGSMHEAMGSTTQTQNSEVILVLGRMRQEHTSSRSSSAT